MRWIALLMFGGLGLASLVGGAWWGLERYQVVKDGVLVEGEVVAQAEHASTRPRGRFSSYRRTVTGYYPVVEFRTEDGATLRVEGSTGGGGQAVLATGTRVPVLYRRDDPSDAVIVDFQQAWLGPLVLAVVGAVLLAMGGGGFVLIGRNDRVLEELQATLRRDALALRPETRRIRATVTHVRALQGADAGKYVLVCKGLRPGEHLASEFCSDALAFEPDRGVVGRRVPVLLDPEDRYGYRVDLGELQAEMRGRR